MSQDVDGSGLISLICVLWVLLNIYDWNEHQSLPTTVEREARRGNSLVDARRALLLTGTTVAPDIEALIREIIRRDGSGTIEAFLDERLAAYEEIVAAFHAGDLRLLSDLVSPEVYQGFASVINARQHSVEILFSQIELPEILAGSIDETHMEVSIRLKAEFFKLSRERPPDKCHSIDVWTFGRALSSPAHEWRLFATEVSI